MIIHEPEPLPSWERVQERALFDPILYAATTFTLRGTFSREQALCWALLLLSEQLRSRLVDEVARRAAGDRT